MIPAFGLVVAGILTGCQMVSSDMSEQPETSRLDPVQLSRISEHLEANSATQSRAGYVVIIRNGAGGEYLKAFGMRDISAGAPMALDTEFRIASLTKPVVSAAVMRLVERGDLRLTDPVVRYLPEFAQMEVGVGLAEDGTLQTEPAKRAITIYDLLTHTAGLGASGQAELPANVIYAKRYAEFFEQESLADASKWIAGLPLVFQPGEGWGYSFSLDVLGRIIEVRTGKSVEDALEELVLSPLGMTHTYYNRAGIDRSNLATLYISDADGKLQPFEDAAIDKMRFPMSGGGLISTAGDYMNFLEMMRRRGEVNGEQFLSQASVEAMTRNALPEAMGPIRLELNMMGAGFGLGFGVVSEDRGIQSLLAPGDYFWAGATDTFAFVSPSRDISAVILSQYWPNERTREWDTLYDFADMASAAVVQP
jgi:CubicO group peptidase (beta-lactamase class C family)